jgi:hypothetical protein
MPGSQALKYQFPISWGTLLFVRHEICDGFCGQPNMLDQSLLRKSFGNLETWKLDHLFPQMPKCQMGPWDVIVIVIWWKEGRFVE